MIPCVCVCSCTVRTKSLSHVWLFATLWTVAHQATLSMGILQAGILQWVAMPSSMGSSKPRFPALQADSSLSHQESPRILEWVAYPFSRRSSPPRNWTGVSCIAGGFFTSWATREAHIYIYIFFFFFPFLYWWKSHATTFIRIPVFAGNKCEVYHKSKVFEVVHK